MSITDAMIARDHGIRSIARTVVTVAALLGLFAMHGLPTPMPETMSMPEPTAVSALAAPTPGTLMDSVADEPATATRVNPRTGPGVSPVTALTAAAPTAGDHGGCDADHVGCVTTLRRPAHVGQATPIPLASAVADPVPPCGDLSRAGTLRRGPPPSRPGLIKLRISRT